MFGSQLLERNFPILNRGMAETSRLRKDEQPVVPVMGIGCWGTTTHITGLLPITIELRRSCGGSMNKVTACSRQ